MRALIPAALLIIGLAPANFEAVQPDLFKAGGALANAWADYDRDGDLDLFVGFNGTTRNRLYRNDKGTFSDVAGAVGVGDSIATRAAAWGDYDGDADADLLVGVAPGNGVLRLYRNHEGSFTDVTADAMLRVDSGSVRQFSWVDTDSDGDLDLFVGMRDRANLFFQNDGGHFKEMGAQLGLADTRKTVGAVWFDYGEDGDLDLYVANQDGDANGLFQNTGGRFRDVAMRVNAEWGGRKPRDATNGSVRPCVADVNNDGYFDLFLANYGKNGLLLGSQSGVFEDASEQWGIAVDARYDTCAFADFDHDGLIDLYVNGTVTGGQSYRDHLYRNTGSRFDDVTPANLLAFHASHGAQWADFDQDGDVDLAIAGTRADATHSLLRNQLQPSEARRSLAIAVVDARGRSVMAGSEVRLYMPSTRQQFGARIVDTGSGYNSQNAMPLHFGLPYRTKVDVEVTVPTRRGPIISGRPAIDPERYAGQVLVLRIGADGRLVRD